MPQISFKNQIYRNILSGWFSIGLIIVANLIITPIILNTLGKELYGVWILIFNFLAYFYLSDFGITNAIVRLFAKYNVDPRSDIYDLISTSFLMIFVLDLFIVLTLFSLIDFFEIFLNISDNLSYVFTFVFLIGLVELATQFLLRVNIAILKGSHKFDIAYRLEGFCALLRLFSVGALEALDLLNIFTFTVCYALSKIMSDSLSFFYIYEHFKKISFKFHRYAASDLFDVGASSLATTISNILITSFPILLFGKLFGVESVALYSIPFAVLIILTRLSNAIYHGIAPKSSELKELSEETEIRRFSSLGVKSALASCFIVFSFAIFFAKVLMKIWLGESVLYPEDFEIMSQNLLLMLIFMLFEGTQKINIFICRSVGLHWLVSLESVVSFLILYISAFILFQSAQELVFALSLALVGVFKLFFYRFVAHTKNEIFVVSIPNLIITLLFLVLFYAFSSISSNYIIILFTYVIGCALYLRVFFRYILDSSEQAVVRREIASFFNRFVFYFK